MPEAPRRPDNVPRHAALHYREADGTLVWEWPNSERQGWWIQVGGSDAARQFFCQRSLMRGGEGHALITAFIMRWRTIRHATRRANAEMSRAVQDITEAGPTFRRLGESMAQAGLGAESALEALRRQLREGMPYP